MIHQLKKKIKTTGTTPAKIINELFWELTEPVTSGKEGEQKKTLENGQKKYKKKIKCNGLNIERELIGFLFL